MDAAKYLKEICRMCDSIEECTDCPFYRYSITFPCKIKTARAKHKGIEKCVSIVEKWSADHPVKTRQSEFLKMFPNAPLHESGSLTICPLDVDHDAKCSEKQGARCIDCRKEYWFTEVSNERD